MLNMARADFYRLFRSKGFYITEVVLICLVILSVVTNSLGSIVGNSETLATFQAASNKTQWSAVKSVAAMSSMASILIYIILPIFIMTIGFEFSRKTYKNPLSSGMTRINYFISKYLIFVIMCIPQFLFFYLTVFVTSWIKNGAGKITGHFLWKMLGTLGIQLMEISALFAIAVLIIYAFFSTIAAVIVTIVVPLIPSILSLIFKKVDWIKFVNFQTNIDTAYPTRYTNTEMDKLIFFALGTILVCLVLSFLSFRKRDL